MWLVDVVCELLVLVVVVAMLGVVCFMPCRSDVVPPFKKPPTRCVSAVRVLMLLLCEVCGLGWVVNGCSVCYAELSFLGLASGGVICNVSVVDGNEMW